MVSYNGHFNPTMAVQVTKLQEGVFIGFSVNHVVVDGTSLWNLLFAEVVEDWDVFDKGLTISSSIDECLR
ncbi:hypothetical protein R6Q59_033541 [Mikania micrantha]